MNALESDAPLIVYIDIKSPYAFAAIRPTLALEKSLGMRFDWRPLTLDIPSYLGSARKKKGKVVKSTRNASQWSWVKYAYRDARRYVERQGYMLKGTEKIWDSSIPNIGILWVMQTARDRLSDFFEAVYPPFWRRELDIEDIAVVETCMEKAGIASSGFAKFAQGEGRIQHDQLQPQLHPGGIYGVPTYVIDGTILFGREHLPYVRWHLMGREGPAPDIAYEIDDLEADSVGGRAMLTVYIDFKSAVSYLALEATLELAQETGITIDWRPFSVRSFSVPREQDEETVGERHRRVRAAAQRDVHLHYAAVQGRHMHFADAPAGSDAALAALAMMEGDAAPFLRAAFAAYWTEQADLADEGVVETLLRSVGMDPPDWETAHAKLDSIRSKAEESGIFEAPSYLIADQLFLGREHLPWIRSLIPVAQSA